MKQTVIFDMHMTLFRLKNSDVNSIEAMPQAIETFLSFYNLGYKIVIMSTSDIQNSRERLQILLQNYGLETEEIKIIFKEIDILSMQFFGSKHTKEAWLEAMKPYKNISYIFEDGEAKLHAAGEAAKELGNDAELFTSVADFAN